MSTLIIIFTFVMGFSCGKLIKFKVKPRQNEKDLFRNTLDDLNRR